MVEMSPEAITARLREMSRLSAGPARQGLDMSAEAVTARLREMAEMSDLCWQLQSLVRAEDGPRSDR